MKQSISQATATIGKITPNTVFSTNRCLTGGLFRRPYPSHPPSPLTTVCPGRIERRASGRAAARLTPLSSRTWVGVLLEKVLRIEPAMITLLKRIDADIAVYPSTVFHTERATVNAEVKVRAVATVLH